MPAGRPASSLFVLCFLALAGTSNPGRAADPMHSSPSIIRLDVESPAGGFQAADVGRLVAHYRDRADSFVFLSGGASRMTTETRDQLLSMFDAFRILSDHGLRFAVGDGGTRAGICDAAGKARLAAEGRFPLLGVCPESDVSLENTPGKTQLDPNHSDVVLVRNEPWVRQQTTTGWQPSWGHWGSETGTMYELFGRLAEGRRSVTVVANGGAITLDEVAENVRQGRRMIVIWGSGRAADAICSSFTGIDPAAPTDEYRKLKTRVLAMGLQDRVDLFAILPISRGGNALATAIERELVPARP